MSCKFGIATAGEHAGFKVATTLQIVAGGTTSEAKGESEITKVEGAIKDADGFSAIELIRIA